MEDVGGDWENLKVGLVKVNSRAKSLPCMIIMEISPSSAIEEPELAGYVMLQMSVTETGAFKDLWRNCDRRFDGLCIASSTQINFVLIGLIGLLSLTAFR